MSKQVIRLRHRLTLPMMFVAGLVGSAQTTASAAAPVDVDSTPTCVVPLLNSTGSTPPVDPALRLDNLVEGLESLDGCTLTEAERTPAMTYMWTFRNQLERLWETKQDSSGGSLVLVDHPTWARYYLDTERRLQDLGVAPSNFAPTQFPMAFMKTEAMLSVELSPHQSGVESGIEATATTLDNERGALPSQDPHWVGGRISAVASVMQELAENGKLGSTTSMKQPNSRDLETVFHEWLGDAGEVAGGLTSWPVAVFTSDPDTGDLIIAYGLQQQISVAWIQEDIGRYDGGLAAYFVVRRHMQEWPAIIQDNQWFIDGLPDLAGEYNEAAVAKIRYNFVRSLFAMNSRVSVALDIRRWVEALNPTGFGGGDGDPTFVREQQLEDELTATLGEIETLTAAKTKVEAEIERHDRPRLDAGKGLGSKGKARKLRHDDVSARLAEAQATRDRLRDQLERHAAGKDHVLYGTGAVSVAISDTAICVLNSLIFSRIALATCDDYDTGDQWQYTDLAKLDDEEAFLFDDLSPTYSALIHSRLAYGGIDYAGLGHVRRLLQPQFIHGGIELDAAALDLLGGLFARESLSLANTAEDNTQARKVYAAFLAEVSERYDRACGSTGGCNIAPLVKTMTDYLDADSGQLPSANLGADIQRFEEVCESAERYSHMLEGFAEAGLHKRFAGTRKSGTSVSDFNEQLGYLQDMRARCWRWQDTVFIVKDAYDAEVEAQAVASET